MSDNLCCDSLFKAIKRNNEVAIGAMAAALISISVALRVITNNATIIIGIIASRLYAHRIEFSCVMAFL